MKKSKTSKVANDVREMLKSDDKVVRFRRIVKSIEESVDLDALNKELRVLHAGRKVRNMWGKAPTIDALSTASMQEAAYRARMAEMRVEVTEQASILQRGIKAIRGHVLSEYSDNVAQFKTRGERMEFADQFMSRAIGLLDRMEDFMNRADYLIKDIDQAGFNLKNNYQTLNLIYSKNNDKSL